MTFPDMPFPEKPGDPDQVTVLPCGCVITCTLTPEREMRVAPCRMDCVNVQNTLDLAAKANLPVERRRAP